MPFVPFAPPPRYSELQIYPTTAFAVPNDILHWNEAKIMALIDMATRLAKARPDLVAATYPADRAALLHLARCKTDRELLHKELQVRVTHQGSY